MSSGLTVWSGHRGDGDVAVSLAGALDLTQQHAAMQASHDLVIRSTGRLRAGPVTWRIWPAEEGLAECRAASIEVPTELETYLRTSPASLLVLAAVPTDRKRPGRKATRPSRKASR